VRRGCNLPSAGAPPALILYLFQYVAQINDHLRR
jgi:hypothetical protein